MKKNIIPIVVLVFVLALPLGIAAAAQSSPALDFNTTENFTRLNTTNSWNNSFTITSNTTDLDITIDNATVDYNTAKGTITYLIMLENGTFTNQTNITGTPGNSTTFFVNITDVSYEPSIFNATLSVNNGTEELNFTMEIDLLHDLETVINDVGNSTAFGDSTLNASTQNLTINASVEYPFDVVVDGLNITNNITAALTGINATSDESQPTKVSLVRDGNFYNITLNLDDEQEGGYYNLTLTTDVVNGTVSQSDSYTFENLRIIETPGLNAVWSSVSNVEDGESDEVHLVVTNYGDQEERDARAKITVSGELASVNWDDTDTDCNNDDETDDSTKTSTIEFDLAAGASCTIKWDVTGGDTKGDGDITFTGSNGVWYDTSIVADMDVTTSASSSTTTSSTSSSSAASTAAAADEDEHELTINSYPSLIEVVQGNSSTIELEIENTGDLDEENVLVYVDDIESSWVTLPPSFRLNDGNDKTVEITFTVPNTTRVKEYNITIGAANDDVGVSTDTRFRVMPSAETIAALNTTLEELEENVTQFEKDVLKALKEINESDRTQHESDLESIKSKLSTAKESSDNFTTASLIAEIQDDMASTRNALGIEEGSSSLPWGRIILITLGSIAGLGVVALVVYMILPPNEGVAAAKSAKKPLSERLKEFWKKLFKKKGYDPKKGFRH